MIRLIFIIILNITIVISVFAQPGTSGLAFLKLGVGSKALSMGEAYTSLSNDPSAIFYNPAGLAFSSKSQILFMHREWIQDTKIEFLGASTTIDNFAFGFGINSTNINYIEYRTTPGPAEGTFSTRNAAIGIVAAYRLDSTFSLGIASNYIYEKIFIEDATGYSINTGIIYVTPWRARLGLSVNNLGSMNGLLHSSSKLPTIYRFGASDVYKIESIQADITASFDFISIPDDNKQHLHFGGEFVYKNIVALRLGYQTGYDSRNITGGIGVKYSILGLDYAFNPMNNNFANTHTLSVSLEF